MSNDFKNDDIRDLIIERDGYLQQVKELEQELQRKDNIINEVKDIINRMIYMGYCAKTGKGTTATNFMATGENSEFGTRAKYILDKIEELENDN